MDRLLLVAAGGALGSVARYLTGVGVLRLAGLRTGFGTANGTFGWPDEAPFDRIVVTAGGPSVPPPLLEQLAEGGRMVMPVGFEDSQHLQIVEKAAGQPRLTEDSGCVFVKLIGKYAWEA